MIHESAPWRDHLAKDADRIDRWAAKPSATERRSFLIERKVFLAAYAMRKLFEARKLSSSTENKNIPGQCFPAFDRTKITSWNAYKFEKLYDLSKPVKKTLNIRVLIDIIVHSLLFCESIDQDEKLTGFLITSERKRDVLWLIDLSVFTSLMRFIAKDRPAQIHRTRVGNAETWLEWRSSKKKK